MAEKTKNADGYLQFSRAANTCLLCSAPLNVDGRHPSLIQLSERAEVIRKDFCPTCWGRLGEEEYFSFWVTKRVNALSPEQRRLAKSERNEALWRLFAALYASEGPDLSAQLFLLAHLLLRYRVLAYDGTTPTGNIVFLHPKLGERFEIPDLPLDSVDFVSIKSGLEQQALQYADDPSAEPTDGTHPESETA